MNTETKSTLEALQEAVSANVSLLHQLRTEIERLKAENASLKEELEEYENRDAESAWDDRMEDGETMRGSEAAAFEAEKQAWIQRNLK